MTTRCPGEAHAALDHTLYRGGSRELDAPRSPDPVRPVVGGKLHGLPEYRRPLWSPQQAMSVVVTQATGDRAPAPRERTGRRTVRDRGLSADSRGGVLEQPDIQPVLYRYGHRPAGSGQHDASRGDIIGGRP